MKLLFCAARPFYPHFTSGADVSNFELIAGLAARGSTVNVLGCAPAGSSQGLHYAVGGLNVSLLTDQVSLFETLQQTLRHDPPDVLLTACPGWRGERSFEEALLAEGKARDIPLALFVRDLVETTRTFDGLHQAFRVVIANSSFVSAALEQRWELSAPVIYPVPDPTRCQLAPEEWRGGYLTMFNPIAPKGVRITLSLAAFHLRHKHFMLVEGWLPLERLEVRRDRFPNVRWEPRNVHVRDIYAETDVLLVPSQWAEPFGRVALEGLLNGLPVVASAVGGLPEILSGSPLLVDAFDQVEAWAERLAWLEVPEHRAEVAAWGRARAACFDYHQQVARLEAILEAASQGTLLL